MSDTPNSAAGGFSIAGQIIAPGERRMIAIPISQDVTGLSAQLALQVIHGTKAGPAVFVSGAIHGDEIVGTAIIQKLVEQLDPATVAGTVILAPAVNIFGFVGHSRYLPDRRDLNRSFPGSERGSLASQLAHCFLTNVIDICDLGIDIHSAAVHRYNLPQIRIAADDDHLTELAMAFGAPIIVESPLRDGSMRELAAQRGTPMLLLEAGEALRFDHYSLEVGSAGVMKVLAHLGMVEADDGLSSPIVPFRANRSNWVRAPRGGVSQRSRQSGDVVREGEVLARVGGLFGEEGEDVVSPFDGMIIGHATLPVLNQGDAMFHIAELNNIERAGHHAETIVEAINASEPPFPALPQQDEDEVE